MNRYLQVFRASALRLGHLVRPMRNPHWGGLSATQLRRITQSMQLDLSRKLPGWRLARNVMSRKELIPANSNLSGSVPTCALTHPSERLTAQESRSWTTQI
jgi:hypothetical protein